MPRRPLSQVLDEYPQLRGPSAYEVAVGNGFNGTEQQWLESLAADNVTDPGDLGVYFESGLTGP